MRSQIILALLATAITAAPVLTTGDAKVGSLSSQAAPTDTVVLTHHCRSPSYYQRASLAPQSTMYL
jgi:hypothetical protein